MEFHGARYLHILVPCPLGWGSSPADTIKVARLATECGLFPVFEAETGTVVSSTPIRRRVPVADYLRMQARYAHLFSPAERTATIERIQALADRNIARFGLCRRTCPPTRPGRPLPPPRSVMSMHKPFAITLDAGLEPGQPNRRLAHRAARLLDSLPPCNNACPAGENIQQWLYHAEEGGERTRPPGGRSCRTTRSPPSWAGSATGRARPPATGPSWTRPSASTPSSDSWATRPSGAAGSARRRGGDG